MCIVNYMQCSLGLFSFPKCLKLPECRLCHDAVAVVFGQSLTHTVAGS